VSPLRGLTVREPCEDCYAREPPLFAKAPAGQVALFRARSDSVNRQFEKSGSPLEGEDFVGERGRRVCRHLNSPHGNGAGRRQPICQQVTDELLLETASHVSQTVEGDCLIFRQSDEEGGLGRHHPE
jgi:hypothetical protein